MTHQGFKLGWLLAPLMAAACSGDDGRNRKDDDGSSGEGVCGDGAVDDGEECDGGDLAGKSCESLGFGAGALRCKPSLCTFDRADCGAPESCGNGSLDEVEICDGSELGGATCESLGFGPGELACLPNCGDYDLAGCGAPPGCGNDVVGGVEVCDGTDLAGQSCESLGLGAGELTCRQNCSGFETRGCGPVPSCGNGVIDDGEICDGSELGGADCESLGHGAGMLACASDCMAYDEAACVSCDLDPLTQSGTLDFDLETVTVTGTVTENGLALANDPEHRGNLVFVDTTTGDSVSRTLGYSGAATYSVELFASTYDVFVSTGYYQTALPPDAYHKLAEGVLIDASTVKNFDLDTIVVTGTVTENGATLANDPEHRGNLVFVDTSTSDSVSRTLGYSGAATYSVELFASSYDIFVSSGYYQTVLPPDAYHRLQSNVAITSSTTKNFDLDTIVVTGTVTENGATLANDPEHRGNLVFVDTSTGDSVSRTLGYSGAATYSLQLFASTYDVFVSSGYYQTVLPPDAYHKLSDDVLIDANAVKNFDLDTVTVTGTVTENGATLANDAEHRGNLVFVDTSTGDSVSRTLGYSGAATYSLQLFASTYDVFVSTGYYQTVLPPDAYHRLQSNVTIAASSTKNFDLDTILVTGTVTENGATLANDAEHRGNLVFVDTSTGDSVSRTLGYSGPATYSLELFASTYDVFVSSGYYQTVLPPDAYHRLEAGVALNASTNKSFDLDTIVISGTVTENGLPLANDAEHRGNLVFVDTSTGDSVSRTLGYSGAATYSLELFASSYDVFVSTGYYQTMLPPDAYHRLATGCPE